LKVFLTGGSGFVGLNLAALLLSRGDDVALFSATPPLAGAMEELSKLPGRLTAELGDVTDSEALRGALVRSGAKHVVHIAAVTAGVDRDAREPRRVVEVNVLGTLHVLEAARHVDAQRFVLASTGAVFGSESFPPDLVTEDHLPSPVTMYDISKYAAERSVLHLGQLWDLDVVAGRLPMVFGSWEYRTGLRDNMSALWQLSRLARQGGEPVVPELGVQDWMYAPDAARALSLLLDAPVLQHRLYHLGIEAPWGLIDWAQRLAARFPEFRFRTTRRDDECTVAARGTLGRTAFNTKRLRDDFGFHADFDLDSSFEHYMNWLDEHPAVWNDTGGQR